ncbi:MAG: 5-formyltetrahydrofolate cyclo-ligase [Pseudomonadota bacterium]
MLPPIGPFFRPKMILRERAKIERRAAAEARPDAARHAAANFQRALHITDDEARAPGDVTVALYHPIKDEIDPGPLAAFLDEAGVSLALPVVQGKKEPLAFRTYRLGAPLVKGAYGAMVPGDDAPFVTPDIVVTPLLAFTRAGGRLGYGGGYYDRTLEALREAGRVTAVGFAYGAQEVDALPLSPLDQTLDWVVTEREAIRCRAVD